MNREDVLVNNCALLSKDMRKNDRALVDAYAQLFDINPQLGLKLWEEAIRENMSDIAVDFGQAEFSYRNYAGKVLIKECEDRLVGRNHFQPVVEEFADNKYLLDILYARSPITKGIVGATYGISYLIRHNKLQKADNIISAIYKNATFEDYPKLWHCIINMLEYREYNPGLYDTTPAIQPEHIQKFCMEWINKIEDVEARAGALVFAMNMY